MKEKLYDLLMLITFFLGVISLFCFAVQLISLGLKLFFFFMICSIPIIIRETFLR